MNTLPVGEAATTIITFEEQTRGWLSVVARSRSLDEQVEAYRRLKHEERWLNSRFEQSFWSLMNMEKLDTIK